MFSLDPDLRWAAFLRNIAASRANGEEQTDVDGFITGESGSEVSNVEQRCDQKVLI